MDHPYDSGIALVYFCVIGVLSWLLATTGAVFVILLFLSRDNPNVRTRIAQVIRASAPMVVRTMVLTSCLLVPLINLHGMPAFVLTFGLLFAVGVWLTVVKKEET